MVEVINLNRARKARAKAAREADAAANRAKFGRTGAEKRRDRDEARRAAEALDAHRLAAPPTETALPPPARTDDAPGETPPVPHGRRPDGG